MTLIIAGKCKDGVVIVADRKVTNSRKLVNKIRQPKNLNVVFTAGGYQSVFEDYLEDLTKNVDYSVKWLEEENKTSPIHREYDYQQFKKTCIETLTELKQTHRALGENESFENILQVFFTMPEQKEDGVTTRLYRMDMDNCLPEAVEDNTIEAIGYKPIAMPLLRSLENEHDITMREVARVATFAIKFIEQEELSSGGVGVGDQEPQIYFEPNGVDPHEITGEALSELLRGVDEEVKNVRNMIGSTSSFLRA